MSDIDIGRRISYPTASVEGHAVAVIVSQTASHKKTRDLAGKKEELNINEYH